MPNSHGSDIEEKRVDSKIGHQDQDQDHQTNLELPKV